MTTDQNNFRSWYVDILDKLYPHREAGFAIMMIAIPLLERYLRQKARLQVQAPLNQPFYDELIRLFPVLTDLEKAKQFWQVFRNGLLHEVTMSPQDRKGNQMPAGSLSHDIPEISVLPDGTFFVHPVDFAKRVIKIIEDDFAIFAGNTSATKLPRVKQHAPGIESSTTIILSTSSNP